MDTILGIPTITWKPILLWIGVMLLQFPWIIWCLSKIEASGAERLGATGSIWTPYKD